MKITLLKSGFGAAGGLEKVTLRLAHYLQEEGHSVTLLTTGAGFSSDTLNVISLGVRSKIFSFKHLLDFDRWCKEWLATHPQDLVIGLDRNTSQDVIRLGNGIHRRQLSQRCYVENPIKKLSLKINPLQQLILRREKIALQSPSLSRVICNSEMVANEVNHHYSVAPSKLVVIHNGVEWSEMATDFANQDYSSRPYTFCFVGHGYRRKGLNQLLSGLAQLNQEWRLYVLGKDKCLEAYQREADPRVTFVGPSQHVRRYLQQSDCLVVPSLYDPFANVTVEALAMGLFVVSSKYNGGKEVLTQETGCVIDNLFDPTSVAAALSTAMSHPKDRERAQAIRQSVAHLDYPLQLPKLAQACLSTGSL